MKFDMNACAIGTILGILRNNGAITLTEALLVILVALIGGVISWAIEGFLSSNSKNEKAKL